jgi:CheY-like chemotaxis protein
MANHDDLTGKRIVLCEDEGMIVMQLDRAFTKAGLVIVGKANNGKEGLEMVLREKPDLVLMDVRMPVMDGLEATRQIMTQRPTCVILLTAQNDDLTREQARSCGAVGFVPKPITSETLLSVLRQALQIFYERHP